MHKGVDIAREAPRLIVSATNEPLASIIVVQTYYTLGWAQKSICILGWATTYTFMIHYNQGRQSGLKSMGADETF